MDVSSIFGSGGFPKDAGGIAVYVLICVLVLLVTLLAIYLIAVVLGLILRLIFRQLRFIVVFVLSLAAFAIFAALVFFKPLTNGGTGDTFIAQVAEKYKGLYPSGVPLIAWRVTDITDSVPQYENEVIPDKKEGERIYKVSYLPFGELIARVDSANGAVEITSLADGKTVSANIKDLTDQLIESVKRGATKTVEGIKNGVVGGAKYVTNQTNNLITGNGETATSP